MVNTLDDAENAIKYSKYPPIGQRGVGLSRAQRYDFCFEKYKKFQEKELNIMVQIENILALKELLDILSLNQIDGIIIGPYDLSASMGQAGAI